MTGAASLSLRMLAAVDELRAAGTELEKQARSYATTERDYRRARAIAYLQAGGTVGAREATADHETADLRYARDLADGLKVSALEAVRSARATLSALQSIAGLEKAEAEFTRFGSREAVGV